MMSSHNEPKSIGSSKLKVTVAIIFVLSVISAIALSVINRLYIAENYLYINGAPTAVLPILAFVTVIVAIFGMLSVRKNDYSPKELPNAGNSLIYTVSLLLVAEFLAIFVLYVMYGAFDIGYGASIKNDASLLEKLETATLFYQLMIILTPLAPVYFVIVAFKQKISSFFGSITLLWILAYILRLYFDVTDWVMSPRKLSMICAMCFAALFMLYEIRFSFGRGNVRRYFFISSLTSVFCFSAGLAGVLSSLFGVFPSSFEIPYYGVAFALGVYAGARIYSLAYAKRTTETEDAEEAETEAEEDENEEETEEVSETTEGSENI